MSCDSDKIQVKSGLAHLNRDDLIALYEFSNTIHQLPTLDQLLETALRILDQNLGLPHSEIWLLDDLIPLLKLAARYGFPSDPHQKIFTCEFGLGLPGAVAEQVRPILVTDLEGDPFFIRRPAPTQCDFSAGLGLPLTVQENLMGVLIFYAPEATCFTPEVIRLLVAYNQPLSIAIRNAHLLDSNQMFQSAKLASVGELAAGVAHEINNPIFVIRQFAELVLEDTATTHPNYNMLKTIINESDRIADIVRNLLDFSRPSKVGFSSVYLWDIWLPVYRLIQQSLQEHNIHLAVTIPNNLPPIRANDQQIQQVLLNLVTNARDALREKYPANQRDHRKQITVKAQTRDDLSSPSGADAGTHKRFVEISVRDDGVGISAEDKNNLFNPFFTTKRPNKGTGLGLSICHKIVEEHDGKIEVISEKGVFTEFKIILPVDEAWHKA